jgi:glycosyltransferase involved in cell wall biosynthesis
MKNVILLQTAIADYRDNFISGILDEANKRNYNLKIICGTEYFEVSTQTSNYVRNLPSTNLVSNFFILKKKFLFQFTSFFEILNCDALICELNPRIINTWFFVIIRRLLKKKTVCWGHAWPRGGKESKTELVRSILKHLSTALLLYTHTQKSETIEKYINFRDKIYVAPNSLYFKKQMKNVFNNESKDIIYVGRLVSQKNIKFLILACQDFLSHNNQSKLHIVGTGELLEELKNLSTSLNIEKQVIFHGHIHEREKLEKIYSLSFISISPGYVGLSITQSFSFGIPMLISDNENHSPEIEAFLPCINGSFFEKNNVMDFNIKLMAFYKNRKNFDSNAEETVKTCRENYSIEKMVQGFYDSIE